MRRNLLVFVLLLAAPAVWAQKMFEEKLVNCPLKFELEDREQFIHYEPNDSLLYMDFLAGMEQKDQDKIYGVVMFQIMLDTAYNNCLVSYTNKTNIRDKKMDILPRIQNMPGWKRVTPESMDEVNICALVSIFFDKKEVTVSRIGYNRNRGKHSLSEVTFNRFAADSLPAPVAPAD